MGLRDQLRAVTADILATTGIATMLVTHDREEAMGFADQLVVLREGRLAQAGDPRNLYLAPADATVAEFLGPSIILDAEIRNGVAHCALGFVPLAGHAGWTGRGRILLRPEQLHLAPADGLSATWQLQSVQWVGGTAYVSIRRPEQSVTLRFPSGQYELPAAGERCTVRVSGTGCVLGR